MSDLLRMGDLVARFGVTRWTIHRWVRELEFPPGASSPASKGNVWEKADVDTWAKANLLPGLGVDGQAPQS